MVLEREQAAHSTRGYLNMVQAMSGDVASVKG
jgi:hypothetical protein